MDKIFLAVLNMSLVSSFAAIFVVLARLPLRRAPRWISYALWAAVLFNLVCPYKLSSPASMVPFEENPVKHESVSRVVVPEWGNPELSDASEDFWRSVAADSNYIPERAALPWFNVLSYIWISVLALMLFYAAFGYLRIKRRVRFALRVERNVYECGRITSPFVLGLVRPRIYIPPGMSPSRYGLAVLHERTHIRRRDYIVSAAAFLVLSLHWFNPIIWISYILMLRDLESSCDEAVLRRYGGDMRREYSCALLSFSSGKRSLPIPLAFGEQAVKERIKNVLKYKKASKLIIAAAIILAVAITAGCALVRPVNSNTPEESAGVIPDDKGIVTPGPDDSYYLAVLRRDGYETVVINSGVGFSFRLTGDVNITSLNDKQLSEYTGEKCGLNLKDYFGKSIDVHMLDALPAITAQPADYDMLAKTYVFVLADGETVFSKQLDYEGTPSGREQFNEIVQICLQLQSAYADDTLTKLTKLSDDELLSFASNSDGAYSEGAFHELSKRFDDHTLELCALIADETIGIGNVDRMNICKMLATEYIMQGRTRTVERIAVLFRILDEQPRAGSGIVYDDQPYRIVNAVHTILSDRAVGMHMPQLNPDGSITEAGYAFLGLEFNLSAGQHSISRDYMFDDGLTFVEYYIITVASGTLLNITAPFDDSLTPRFRLNYGYELGSQKNTLIEEPTTVTIAKDLKGIMERESGLPVVVFNVG